MEAKENIFLTEKQRDQITYARKFMPWANKAYISWAEGHSVTLPPFTDEEIWGVLAQCQRKRLNPSDSKQVQIWKDKNGISVVDAYRVSINWLDLQGGHSPERYTRLVGDALKAEGITNPLDIVFECTFVMDSDLPRLIAYKQAGIDPTEALAMVTHRGIGRVTASEYMKGNQERAYAAPKGRTPADKARKRAFIDAINNMGLPTDDEYRSMSTLNRAVRVLPQHLEGTEGLAYDDARALATARAVHEQLPALTQDEQAAGAESLWPGSVEVNTAPDLPEEVEATPEPETTSPPTPDDEGPIAPAERPWQPEHVRNFVRHFARTYFGNPIAERNLRSWRGALCGQISKCFSKSERDDARHAILSYLTGNPSSKTLSQSIIMAISEWLVDRSAGTEEDRYPLRPTACQEARRIFELASAQDKQEVIR